MSINFNHVTNDISASSGSVSINGSVPGGGGSTTLTISNKTGAYTVVAGDNGTVIKCTTGSFTVSLTAAATLGSGFNVRIANTGTGIITITPNGTEKMSGQSTWYLRANQEVLLVCDGSNFIATEGNCVSSGASSAAYGLYSLASGTESTAIGYNTTASGQGSIAIGSGTNAGSTNSVAIGKNSSGGASQTPAGTSAMALGGSYASGTDSFAAAVANNTSTYGATGANSVAMGYRATASGSKAVAIGGETATASISNAVAIGGEFATASGSFSVALGGSVNTASGESSYAFGARAQAVQVLKYAYGHALGTSAACQGGYMVLAAATTDATATVLRSNTNAATTLNQLILPNNSAYAFTGTVVARRQAAGGTESAAWKVEGLIRREGTAGTTTLVASTVTAISNVPGWTLALSADTTNGGLAVTATGAAATNIRWVATINTSEVTYA